MGGVRSKDIFLDGYYKSGALDWDSSLEYTLNGKVSKGRYTPDSDEMSFLSKVLITINLLWSHDL